MFRALFFLLLLATAIANAAAQPRTASSNSRPDIFLITIDTLRADHVHCYGYEKVETPALDSLAREGFRFSQAFTPSPITNTSHTTILTGLLPSDHGVTDFAIPLSSAHLTLAEVLKQHGYHTAAFIGAVILDSKTLAPGLDRGFDYYDNFPEHADTKSRWGRVERRGMDVVQHVESWLTSHQAGPHFVWVHLYDPHDPYEPPPPFLEKYQDRLYDGEIAYADSALANFLAYLKRQGWYQHSLIIAVGDHGEGLGEHNEDTHGIFLYDSTMHVPLIIKIPTLKRVNQGAAASKTPAQVIDAQVRTTDILPTALEFAGVAPPGKLDGASLKEYLDHAESASRTAFGETDYPLRFGWAPLRSVRDRAFKYIAAPRPELYDLRSDPRETRNIYDAGNPQAQNLSDMLAQLRSKQPATAPANAESANKDLHALGYAGDSAGTASTSTSSLPDPKDKIEEQNLLHVAMLASEDNRQADARAALEKVLSLNPKSPTALLQLGQLELQDGEYAKAADYLGRARTIRPDDATAAWYQGQALEKTGDLAGARDALETSLKFTPSQPAARVRLGNVYLGLKNPQAADDQFEAALLVDPNSLDAQLGLAKVALASNHADDALKQLQPLSESQPRNSQVFDLLAQAYAAVGNKAAAEKAAQKADSLRGSRHAK
ncbi:MAG TPA: sulfatase-like hydrolase/transferase [Terriglobales bacterium]|nr:sulfatase-like hydrolase/transferase [Terriglobales bacterium]